MAPTKPQASGMTTRRSARIAARKNIAAGSDTPKPSPRISPEPSRQSSRQPSPKASTKNYVLKSILKSHATSSTTSSSDQGSSGSAGSSHDIQSRKLLSAQGAFAVSTPLQKNCYMNIGNGKEILTLNQTQSLELMKIALHVTVRNLGSLHFPILNPF